MLSVLLFEHFDASTVLVLVGRPALGATKEPLKTSKFQHLGLGVDRSATELAF